MVKMPQRVSTREIRWYDYMLHDRSNYASPSAVVGGDRYLSLEMEICFPMTLMEMRNEKEFTEGLWDFVFNGPFPHRLLFC